MEKQSTEPCQIHALIALLGKSAIRPVDILNDCKDHADTDTGLGAALKAGGVLCRNKNTLQMLS